MSAAASSASPSSTSQLLRVSCPLSTPLPMVALPWGSRSMSSTRRRVAASDAARLTAVVVLPTPPFWFAMAMTRFMGGQCTAPPRPRPVVADRRRNLPSGHQLVRLGTDALARHLVGHRVRRAVLAPRTLEDLGETTRDGLDIREHLRLGAAVVLARDADDAAGVYDVIGRVEDAGVLQRHAVLAVRQLVIGRSRDDAGAQLRDRLGIEHPAACAGAEHVGLEREQLVCRHDARAELLKKKIKTQ